jgi:hypothetical protein
LQVASFVIQRRSASFVQQKKRICGQALALTSRACGVKQSKLVPPRNPGSMPALSLLSSRSCQVERDVVSVRRWCHLVRRLAETRSDQVQRERCSGAGQASALCSRRILRFSTTVSSRGESHGETITTSHSTPTAIGEGVRLARPCSSKCDCLRIGTPSLIT